MTNPLPKRGSETILVAEDDALLRRLAVSILEEFGYTVIAAADGNAAVEQFMLHRNDICLVILDMLMPGKSGRDAYKEIRALSPEIRAIILSGYTEESVQIRDMLNDRLDFAMKPISPIDLLNKVRDMIDRSDAL